MASRAATVGPTLIYGHGNTARAGRGRIDLVTGLLGRGVGRISGTTKQTAIPTNLPVHRRVRLYRQRDGLLMREMWSDATTGAFSFDYVDELQTYYVIAFDYTGAFRGVVGDNLTPDIIS